MTDVLSAEQRRFCMSRIRGKNTKPEIVIRQLVRQMGIGYRLHVKDLPGKPDLVFRKHKKIIFVHGCFWHMHACKYGRVIPKTNTEFWQKKRLSNKLRDAKNRQELNKLGWKSIVIWECQTRNPECLLKKLKTFLTISWGLGSNGTENSVKDYSSPSRFLNGRSSPRFIASGTAKE